MACFLLKKYSNRKKKLIRALWTSPMAYRVNRVSLNLNFIILHLYSGILCDKYLIISYSEEIAFFNALYSSAWQNTQGGPLFKAFLSGWLRQNIIKTRHSILFFNTFRVLKKNAASSILLGIITIKDGGGMGVGLSSALLQFQLAKHM